MMSNLLSNICVSAALLAIGALSVQASYSATRAFTFSLAATMSLAPYAALVLGMSEHCPIWIAALLAIPTAATVSIAYEVVIARNLRLRGVAAWQQMVASLGFFIVIQNVLSVVMGDQPQQWFRRDFANHFMSARELICLVSAVVLIGTGAIYFFSGWGRAYRGLSSNPEAMTLIGFDVELLRFVVSTISGLLAALLGLLAAADLDMTPGSGFQLLLGSMAVAILGGAGSYVGLVAGAVFLASCQHAASWWMDSSWSDAATYFALIAMLIWKPLGFSGRRLKKMEV